MNVERQARRYLRRMIFWRIVGAFADIPVRVCNVLWNLCEFLKTTITFIHGFCQDISHSVFYLELDAARKHQLLTGFDMAKAAGDGGRFHLLDAEYQENDRRARLEDK